MVKNVGDIVKFSFGSYEVTDRVVNARIAWTMKRNRGKCPHCGRLITDEQKVKLKYIYILTGVDKDKGRKAMVAVTYPPVKGRPGLILRLPDKEFMPEEAAAMQEKVKKLLAKKGK